MVENINQAVLLIIIANVLVSMKGFKDISFLDKYKFQIGRILSGEKIRMLTSGFLMMKQIAEEKSKIQGLELF